VRQAQHHAHSLHLGDHVAAEGGEAAVVVLAAAADAVVAVVGQQHPAHAQCVVSLDQAQLIADRVGAFNVEADGELAFRASALDVVGRVDQRVPVAMRQEPVAHRGERAQMVFHALVTEADVEDCRVHAGLAVALQLRQERGVVRARHGHAAVVVPNQRSGQQRARRRQVNVGSRIHHGPNLSSNAPGLG
jgi:hypothetical protein